MLESILKILESNTKCPHIRLRCLQIILQIAYRLFRKVISKIIRLISIFILQIIITQNISVNISGVNIKLFFNWNVLFNKNDYDVQKVGLHHLLSIQQIHKKRQYIWYVWTTYSNTQCYKTVNNKILIVRCINKLYYVHVYDNAVWRCRKQQEKFPWKTFQ